LIKTTSPVALSTIFTAFISTPFFTAFFNSLPKIGSATLFGEKESANGCVTIKVIIALMFFFAILCNNKTCFCPRSVGQSGNEPILSCNKRAADFTSM